ncbi:MAG: serine/threonine-protein kinase [Pseudomonadota bacterium]
MPNWDLVTREAIRRLSGTQDAETDVAGMANDDVQAIDRLTREFMATSMSGSAEPERTIDDGATVGPWRIVGLLGRGGMGEVYRAERADGSYTQTVAIKIMRGADAQRTARFELERQRLAALEHAGIARIIDGGVIGDGRPYMAIEFVDGEAIDQFVDSQKPSLTRRLQLFLELCGAVGYAHGQLVLHRDIKAANVLVDSAGRVRLIDFGIASDLTVDTVDDGPLTLAYAAPEQLAGEPLSVATDVFALGVLLHRLISGELPPRLPDGAMASNAVTNPDLAAIVRRCMAAEPSARYSSVELLAADVRAWLRHMPVVARNGGAMYRLGRFARRYPIAMGLSAALAVSMAIGLASSVMLTQRAQAEAARATASLAEAEYYLDRSEFFFLTNNAYADALQRMFGNDADIERLTALLTTRWEEAFDNRDDNPDEAALLSYAIGRHFLFRNDYPTAGRILGAWIDADIGSELAQHHGRRLLAITYQQTGRAEDAVDILRAVESVDAASYEAGTPDHIATASQIAMISRAPTDVERAVTLLNVGIDTGHGPQVDAFFLASLALMQQYQGDFEAAYKSVVEAVDVIERSPAMDVSGNDTGRINLAEFAYFLERDLVRAEALAKAVVENGQEARGANRETGRALMLQAAFAADSGDLNRALTLADEGVELIQRFSGPTSTASINAQTQLAELLATAERHADAAAVLDALELALSESQPSADNRLRVWFARQTVAALADPSVVAPELTSDQQQRVSQSIHLSYRDRKLRELIASRSV